MSSYLHRPPGGGARFAIRPFGKYAATFTPARTDDLKEGVIELIGTRGTFYAGWVMDDEDSAEYAGQWAMTVPHDSDWPYAWVPECDLSDVEELS